MHKICSADICNAHRELKSANKSLLYIFCAFCFLIFTKYLLTPKSTIEALIHPRLQYLR